MSRYALLALILGLLVFVAATPAETGVRARVRVAVCATFKPCGPALRVAYCESRLDPLARGRAGERGLFQIHPVHFGWLDEARLYEPLYNARIAYRLSRGGRDWHAWSCRP